MGNCFAGPTQDDTSLLRGPDSGPDTAEDSHSPPTVVTRHPPLPPRYTQTTAQQSNEHRPTTSRSSRSVQVSVPVYHPVPGVSRLATQLSEREQVQIARRIGLIQHLPTGLYDGSLQDHECVICMCDFVIGDTLRYLPCVHAYHRECIDDWLMRSFTCPSCMEPVDAALFMSYYTN